MLFVRKSGAIAVDNIDGNITSSITVRNSVNTNIPGDYIVIYSVEDSSGNKIDAFKVVKVVDTTPPTITLIGNTPITIEAGSIYTDAGATAVDIIDGNLTSSIAITNSVNTNKSGDYNVIYSVKDSAGNEANITRVVKVIDTGFPLITIKGSNPATVEAGSIYTDAGAEASDTIDGNLTSSITTTSNVNTNKPGDYNVTYIVKDSAGNEANATRVVKVIDTAFPLIIIKGSNPVTIEAGNTYTDAGAEASDTIDGNLTSSITTISDINTSKPGNYTVIYSVQDSSGNEMNATRVVKVVDTKAPNITIIGSTIVTIEAGSIYTDAGAIAVDNIDGNLTGSIIITNRVNTNRPGDYIVIYRVKDSSGNEADAVRAVKVVDTTPPTITLIGNTPIAIQAGSIYADAGAMAVDSIDGNLTNSIKTINSVNIKRPGDYTVIYSVKDSAGNEANITRVVKVIDTAFPLITIKGSNPITIEAGNIYTDAGAEANDTIDGNLTSSIVTTSDVNTSKPGDYTVTYSVQDSSGNEVNATRVVKVIDTTFPLITIKGSNPITIEAGDTYTDAGAKASDTIDGNLTSSIVTTSDVNTSKPGNYTVTYSVQDSSGNEINATRVVKVVDTKAPTITVIGNNIVIIEAGITYIDAGAKASDSVDGNLTSSIVTTSNVNTNKSGIYFVIYSVQDSSGNEANATRVVKVVDTKAPAITIKGDNPVTIEAGSTYIDAGAMAVDTIDGNLTSSITTINDVNTSKPGDYNVTYSVKDSAGNEANATRVVKVVDTTPPTRPTVPDFRTKSTTNP